MKAADFLDAFGEYEAQPKPGEFLARCPVPEHPDSTPSLWVRITDNGEAKLSCRAGCGFADIVKAAGITREQRTGLTHLDEIDTATPAPPVVLSAEQRRSYAEGLTPGTWTREALDYIRERFGLDAADTERHGLSYRSGRVMFTAREADGTPAFIQGRALRDGMKPRWEHARGRWLSAGYVGATRGSGPVVVCEGPSDALTAALAGFDAVAVPGAGRRSGADLEGLVTLLAGRSPVYVCGDDDRAGRDFAADVTARLPGARTITPADANDLNDMYRADREGFAAKLEELMSADGATPITPERAREIAKGADVDRAEFFADQVRGKLVYVEGPGWYEWAGTHWVNDPSQDQAAARGMVHDVSNVLLELAKGGSDAYLGAAAEMRSSTNIDRLLKEAKAPPQGLRRKVADLDADPYALNFLNGTVDLRSGELRDHDPADLITSVVAYNYRPDADATRWTNYLAASQPDDPVMLTFLQRLAGYGLSGSTAEEKLAFFYGSGRNGKGVFTETIQHIFGPVVAAQNGDFWEKANYGGRSGAVTAKLHGARMVFSSEMSAARLDEAFLKAFVAADVMSANPKYKAPFDFKPSALLVLSGNDKPTIRGTDDGIWARFLCVPWEESFLGREDKKLKPDLEKPEHAEGVIAWCVAGAVDYFAHGLPIPERVSRATEEYREESNPYTDWIETSFTADPDGFLTNSDLKEAGNRPGLRLPGNDRARKTAVLRHFGISADDCKDPRKVDGKAQRGIPGVRAVTPDVTDPWAATL